MLNSKIVSIRETYTRENQVRFKGIFPQKKYLDKEG